MASRAVFPKATLIDRAIAAVSPARGAARLRARYQFANLSALGGAYQGARPDRRALVRWAVARGSANADLLPDLDRLRLTTRDLERNNPIAGAAIARAAILTGRLMPSPQIDRKYLRLADDAAEQWEDDCAREFDLFADSPNCDATRIQNFYGLQELAFLATLQSGDCFAVRRFLDRPGHPYATAVTLYEGDQVSNPDAAPDTAAISGGIETDANGAPLAIHVQATHPGDARPERKWARVPVWGDDGSRQVLHLYDRRRIGAARGVPYLAPVIEQLKQLGTYTDAELMAAVISSMFVVIHKSPQSTQLGENAAVATEAAPAPAADYRLESGSIVDLDTTGDLEVPNIGRPNSAFDPFFVAIVRQVGAILGLPFEVLIMHFTASYSASRAALELATVFVRQRRTWLREAFCDPVRGWFLEEAVARARLAAPGFLADAASRYAWSAADWIGPARISLDPKKENDADAIAEDRGWKTAQEITAERTGGDWERKIDVRGREEKRRKEAGVAVPVRGAAAPSPEPEPDPDQPERN
jgi:lambda family phage portal protein